MTANSFFKLVSFLAQSGKGVFFLIQHRQPVLCQGFMSWKVV